MNKNKIICKKRKKMKIYNAIIISVSMIISTNVYASTGIFGATRYAQTNMGGTATCNNKIPTGSKYASFENSLPIPFYLVNPNDKINFTSINKEQPTMDLTAKPLEKNMTILPLTAQETSDLVNTYSWALQSTIEMITAEIRVLERTTATVVKINLYCKNKWTKGNQDSYTCGSNI
jgi:hypothetical protein